MYLIATNIVIMCEKKLEELTIGSCLSMHISSYDARGKFGEHERSVRVAPGAARSNSSFLPMEMYDENPKQSELVTGNSLLMPSACSTRL